MNFEDILNIAAQKQKDAEKELSTTKRYSTVAKPAKKIVKPKPKSVQSAAIRALLEKKHEEEKKNAMEAKKRMEDAQEVLNKKRKKTDIMKSLSSANTSSKSKKSQEKQEKDNEKYESQEHKVKHMQFMQKVSKLSSAREDVEPRRTECNRPPDRPVPRKKAPPPPSKPMSFQELMKMAEKKKDEPLPLPKIHEELFGEDSDDEEEEKEEPRYVYHSKGRDLDTKGSKSDSSNPKSKSRNQLDKSGRSGSKSDKSKSVLEKSKSSRDTSKASSPKEDSRKDSKMSYTSTSAAAHMASSSTHNGTNKSVTPTKQVVHPMNRKGNGRDHGRSRPMLESASKPQCTLVVESLPSRTTTGPPRAPTMGRGYEHMRRAMKRRHEESEEEFEDDFIDDSNEEVDYSKYIREIFGYDKRNYRYESDREINSMESNFREVMQEEARSTRLAIQEDAEELRKAAADEKRRQHGSKGKHRK